MPLWVGPGGVTDVLVTELLVVSFELELLVVALVVELLVLAFVLPEVVLEGEVTEILDAGAVVEAGGLGVIGFTVVPFTGATLFSGADQGQQAAGITQMTGVSCQHIPVIITRDQICTPRVNARVHVWFVYQLMALSWRGHLWSGGNVISSCSLINIDHETWY